MDFIGLTVIGGLGGLVGWTMDLQLSDSGHLWSMTDGNPSLVDYSGL